MPSYKQFLASLKITDEMVAKSTAVVEDAYGNITSTVNSYKNKASDTVANVLTTDAYTALNERVGASALVKSYKSISTAEAEKLALTLSEQYGNFRTNAKASLYEHAYFNKKGKVVPQNENVNGKVYVFFTRPNMNLFKSEGTLYENGNIASYESGSDSDLWQKINSNKRLAGFLDSKEGNEVLPLGNSTFIPLLSNRIKSFGLMDRELETTESAKSSRDIKLNYALHGKKSIADNTISISFNENRNRDIYTMFDIYTHYLASARLGKISPRYETMLESRLDYDMSIYVIHTLEDGETINFWGKFVCCYPLSAPAGSFDMPEGGKLTDTIVHNVPFYAADFIPRAYHTIDYEFNACHYRSNIFTATQLEKYNNAFTPTEILETFGKSSVGRNIDLFATNPVIIKTFPPNTSVFTDENMIYKLKWIKGDEI
jgi:hypothetical protein